MFFTTERTFLSDGIYIILERRLHHNHHEKKAFSSQLHKENNFTTAVFPVPSELAAGSYNVSIVTKPGNTYFTANIDSVVTVA